MLRDNLQPTDFADADVRVSAWRDFDGFNATAVRVWICRCSSWWFQRHEWAREGKNSTDLEPWILQGFYPRKQFDAHMKPAPKDFEI
jgi:hypothetical protein